MEEILNSSFRLKYIDEINESDKNILETVKLIKFGVF